MFIFVDFCFSEGEVQVAWCYDNARPQRGTDHGRWLCLEKATFCHNELFASIHHLHLLSSTCQFHFFFLFQVLPNQTLEEAEKNGNMSHQSCGPKHSGKQCCLDQKNTHVGCFLESKDKLCILPLSLESCRVSCCFRKKLEELSEERRKGLWALSSPLTNMQLCLIMKCVYSAALYVNLMDPQKI